MIVNGVNLRGFTKEEPFGFIDICADIIGGVYVIIQKNKTDVEIVKIGASASIYSRFANYLSPFRTTKEMETNNRKTKLEFRTVMQDGVKKGYKYCYIFKAIRDKSEREGFEKLLIKEYLSINKKRPKMNNEKWINKYLNNLNSKL